MRRIFKKQSLKVFLIAPHKHVILSKIRGRWRFWKYTHGILVPLISGNFLFQAWPELMSAPVRPSYFGLVVIVGSLLLLPLGYTGAEYFTMRSSLV